MDTGSRKPVGKGKALEQARLDDEARARKAQFERLADALLLGVQAARKKYRLELSRDVDAFAKTLISFADLGPPEESTSAEAMALATEWHRLGPLVPIAFVALMLEEEAGTPPPQFAFAGIVDMRVVQEWVSERIAIVGKHSEQIKQQIERLSREDQAVLRMMLSAELVDKSE